MERNQEIFIPDNKAENAIERTTHLCIAAHQDDVEILAYHGVLQGFGKDDKWFGAVIASDGAGSAREGMYKNYTDDQMKEIRIKEQKKAAYIGEYSFVSLLKYTSSEIKGSTEAIIQDFVDILLKAQPEVLYTHNPADKHPTHIGVVRKVIAALRRLPADKRPKHVYGCEVWRDLDWMEDSKKVKLVVDDHINLERAMLGVFDSQISGGKRYDLASEGRRIANATYAESHSVDTHQRITYAMDLTPLILDDKLTITEYVNGFIEEFKNSVQSVLQGE